MTKIRIIMSNNYKSIDRSDTKQTCWYQQNRHLSGHKPLSPSSDMIRSSSRRLRRRPRSTPLVQFSGGWPTFSLSRPRLAVPPHMIPIGRGFSLLNMMRLQLSPSRSNVCWFSPTTRKSVKKHIRFSSLYSRA